MGVLTRKTSRNQITLPAVLLAQIPATDYFDAAVENGVLVLRPVRLVPAVELEQVRTRLAEQGVSETAVAEAVRWARAGRTGP